MSEAPIDNAVDSRHNQECALETPEECLAVRLEVQQQEDELDATVKLLPKRRPHLRLRRTRLQRMRLLPLPDTFRLPEDELDAIAKHPTIELQYVSLPPLQIPLTPELLQDELDATAKLPVIWLQQTRPLPLQPPDAPALGEAGPVKLKTRLFEWLKTSRVILLNAGSLVGTTAVTSGLGFMYWWVAARQFSPQAVGFASAAISAMTLLGAFAILGLGTLLIGELPRQEGKEASLISAALITVGGVAGCLSIIFAMVAPYLSPDFQILRASIGNIALFAVGVSLTAITSTLDSALIGLLRADLQLWRNSIFAGAKLAALLIVGLWLAHATGLSIYATWAIGNVLSLALLTGFVVVKGGRPGRMYLPQWRLLRKLGSVAIMHHALNLMLQAPPLILPVLVTIVLSATTNAWFYVSWNLASLANVVTGALTVTLYAVSSAQPAMTARRIRLTLSLAFVTTAVVNCVLLLGTRQVLGLFGHSYAEQAAWSLRILSLESFPFIIKTHYIAVSRLQQRVVQATLLTIATGSLELGASLLGAYLGGLTGLSLGWSAAVCIEALLMSPRVYRAARTIAVPTSPDQRQHSPRIGVPGTS